MVGGVVVSLGGIEHFGGFDGDEGCNVEVAGGCSCSGRFDEGAFLWRDDENGRKAKLDLPRFSFCRQPGRISLSISFM